MTPKLKKSKITDIFNGKYLSIWKGEDFYFFSTPNATLILNEEEYTVLKEDLDELAMGGMSYFP